jgi:hypothetical protein
MTRETKPIADTAATSRCLVGYLHGEHPQGSYMVVGVYQDGDDYWLISAGRSDPCRPPTKDMDDVKREAFRLYDVVRWVFEPIARPARGASPRASPNIGKAK